MHEFTKLGTSAASDRAAERGAAAEHTAAPTQSPAAGQKWELNWGEVATIERISEHPHFGTTIHLTDGSMRAARVLKRRVA